MKSAVSRCAPRDRLRGRGQRQQRGTRLSGKGGEDLLGFELHLSLIDIWLVNDYVWLMVDDYIWLMVRKYLSGWWLTYPSEK